MKNTQAEIQGLVIVLRGHFNPVIFNPVWFASEGLIRREEAEKSETQIVHPDVVSFNLDWLRLQVTRDMFFVETTKEHYEEIIRDLVVGTFRLLRHTPLSMLGINRQLHFRSESLEEWNKIGNILAPKDIWKKFLNNPGMRSLSIQESIRDDGLNGYVLIKIEPSLRVQPGLFILINDHFQVKDPDNVIGADEILDILENRWEDSKKKYHKIVSELLEGLDEAIGAN